MNLSGAIVNLLLYGLGPLAILAGTFFFGMREARKADELDRRRAQEEAFKRIQQVQKKLNTLEGERNEKVENLRSVTNTDELIELWRREGWGPSNRDPSKKTD